MQLTQRRPRRARPCAVCSRFAMEIDITPITEPHYLSDGIPQDQYPQSDPPLTDSLEVERMFGNTPSHRTLLTIFAVFRGSEKNLSPSAREETNRMVLVASLILVA